MIIQRWALAALVCLSVPIPALAQAPTAADFARFPELESATLSPDGKHLALAVPAENDTETWLEVVDLATNQSRTLRFGKQQHVTDIYWSADDELVLSRAEKKPFLEQLQSYGELNSTDVEGKHQEVLFAYVPDDITRRGRHKDEGFADVAFVLPHEPGKVLVRFRCWRSVCGAEPPTVIYKVDTRTGDRTEMERINEDASFGFDQSGRARIMTTWDRDDEPVLHYRPHPSDDWRPMPKSLAGRSISAVSFAPDGNTAYATISDEGEPGKLYRLDLAAGTRVKLAGRDDVGIYYIMREGPDGPPFGVVYDANGPSIEYMDPKSPWAQLHLALLQRFPGEMLTIRDASRDGRKILFTAWSDRDPGAWYLFDRDSGKIQLVSSYQSWIKPEQMAPSRPVAFATRDGQKLYGLLTTKGTGPQPLVVMPHGGPFGSYDKWGYDADAQFLASRGYSVLQVNYRGSGGRGERWIQSGWLGWGTTIQNDIADGVHWAIDNKLADPARICVFGGSFGGYSAMMQPILNPGLYKCAIGFAGVYDLNLMRKTDSFSDTPNDRRFFDRTLGADPKALAAISPTSLAAKIGVPVLLVHGKSDKIADFNQFEAMRDALEKAGDKPETLAIPGEGHGFAKPANQVKLYETMAAFLDRNIGPGAH